MKLFGKAKLLPQAILWPFRILFGLIAFLFLFGIGAGIWQAQQIPKWAIKDAPWGVQTFTYANNVSYPSRFYYGKALGSINGVPALNGYWEWDGKHWNYTETVKPFPEPVYHHIDIVRRPETK